MENLYKNYVSHFILILVFVCTDLNLSHIICMDLNLSHIIRTKLNTKFKWN
jgi:hypothetical protein